MQAVVYFGGFFPKLEFSRGFLYILFTGRSSKAAMGGGHYIFPLSKNYKIEGPWLQKDIKLPMSRCLRKFGT
jgi:hypothetical protein